MVLYYRTKQRMQFSAHAGEPAAVTINLLHGRLNKAVQYERWMGDPTLFLTFICVGVWHDNHRWPVEWRSDSSDVAMAANSISVYHVVLMASISN